MANSQRKTYIFVCSQKLARSDNEFVKHPELGMTSWSGTHRIKKLSIPVQDGVKAMVCCVVPIDI